MSSPYQGEGRSGVSGEWLKCTSILHGYHIMRLRLFRIHLFGLRWSDRGLRPSVLCCWIVVRESYRMLEGCILMIAVWCIVSDYASCGYVRGSMKSTFLLILKVPPSNVGKKLHYPELLAVYKLLQNYYKR